MDRTARAFRLPVPVSHATSYLLVEFDQLGLGMRARHRQRMCFGNIKG